MSRVINKPLGELLKEKGVITEEGLKKALIMQAQENRPLGEILVNLGHVSEEDVVMALCTQYGFPYLPLSNYRIHPKIVETIPLELALKHCLIAIDKIGSLLTIAMADPLNADAQEEIEEFTKCDVKVFVSPASEIIKALKEYYKPEKPLKVLENPEELLNKLNFPKAIKIWKNKVAML